MEKEDLQFKDVKYLPSDEALILKNPKSAESPLFILKSYLFSRYSSEERIKINTALTTIGGTLFGLGQSIYKNLPKKQTLLNFGVGSFCIGLSYFTTNEIVNGWVVRQYNKEQYFISNSISAFLNMMLYYGVQNQIRKIPQNIALPQATKYLMTLCCASMTMELIIIGKRDVYLQREQGKHYGFSITKIEGTQSFEEFKQAQRDKQDQKVKELIEQQEQELKDKVEKQLI